MYPITLKQASRFQQEMEVLASPSFLKELTRGLTAKPQQNDTASEDRRMASADPGLGPRRFLIAPVTVSVIRYPVIAIGPVRPQYR